MSTPSNKPPPTPEEMIETLKLVVEFVGTWGSIQLVNWFRKKHNITTHTTSWVVARVLDVIARAEGKA